MDGKNISNRRYSAELWSFTSCSRRTQVRPSDRSTDREHASVAFGLAAILDNFSAFLACICPAKYFLFLSSSLERCKQRTSQCLTRSQALKAVDITLSSFKNQRSDAVFDEFYDSVVVLSAGKNLILRHRKSERQINSSTLQILQQHMCAQPQKITLDTNTMKQ